MNAKPKDAIAALRHYMADRVWPDMPQASLERVLAWADSIPEGAVPVVWPDGCTREEMMAWADDLDRYNTGMDITKYIRALAAIAPQKKKRVVNLWRDGAGNLRETEHEWAKGPQCTWTLVARNVELED